MKYKYKEARHCKLVTELIAKNKTVLEICKLFDISQPSYCYWKSNHKKFRDAITLGEEMLYDRTQAKLFERALGESVETTSEIIEEENDNGSSTRKREIIKTLAPDVGALKTILTNCRPDKWSDKTEVDVKVRNIVVKVPVFEEVEDN